MRLCSDAEAWVLAALIQQVESRGDRDRPAGRSRTRGLGHCRPDGPHPSSPAPFLEHHFHALPGLELDVTLRVPRSKYVAEEYHIRGHQRGDFFRIAPTGKYVDVSWVSMVELRDGKLEDHFYFDVGDVLRQLGLMPSVDTMRGPVGQVAMKLMVNRGVIGLAGAAAAGLMVFRRRLK